MRAFNEHTATAVFGVKDSLIEPFVLSDDPTEAKRPELRNPFYTAEHESCWFDRKVGSEDEGRAGDGLASLRRKANGYRVAKRRGRKT